MADIVWLNNNFIKGGNRNKTAFSVISPNDENCVIWFNKIFYKKSKYDGYFGLEIPITHYQTNEILTYQELEYGPNFKEVRSLFTGDQLLDMYKKIVQNNATKHTDKFKTKEKDNDQEAIDDDNSVIGDY